MRGFGLKREIKLVVISRNFSARIKIFNTVTGVMKKIPTIKNNCVSDLVLDCTLYLYLQTLLFLKVSSEGFLKQVVIRTEENEPGESASQATAASATKRNSLDSNKKKTSLDHLLSEEQNSPSNSRHRSVHLFYCIL